MSEWIRSILDLVLILAVGAGLVQATRLIGHLAGLRRSQSDMERFVHDFNSTVIRAETGIKNLRNAARDSGDDLERLVDKAATARDELQFLVESASQIAERLSHNAAMAIRPEAPAAREKTAAAKSGEALPPGAIRRTDTQEMQPVSSRAEKELLQALRKLS